MSRTRLFTIVVIVALVVTAFAVWRHRPVDDPAAAQTSATAATMAPSTPSPAPSSTTTAPRPDPDSPETVATRAMTIAYTWTPGADSSPTDGFRRAAAFFTPTLAASINSNMGAATMPDRRWAGWADDRARILATVQVGCSGCPPDTDTIAHRVTTITQTAVTFAAATTIEPDTTVWITLTRTVDVGWRIDTLSY